MEQAENRRFENEFLAILRQNVTPQSVEWLQEKAVLLRQEGGSTQLNLAFASVPRKTGHSAVKLTDDQRKKIESIHSGFSIDDWTADRLSRLWLLLQVNPTDKSVYCNKIENLFKAAEMNELAALYSSLFFFAYPFEWKKQCAEGIRSNIGTVLEAIMYNNPYPFKYLDDLAWNQLILKAFFTEKNVKRIIGLDERANKELSMILVDYANERWAAHRSINPQLWRLVSKYIDESNFKYIERAFKSDDLKEKESAALACFHSNYAPAKNLLETDPLVKSAIMENKLNWDTL
jgi:hypothetical protein